MEEGCRNGDPQFLSGAGRGGVAACCPIFFLTDYFAYGILRTSIYAYVIFGNV